MVGPSSTVSARAASSAWAERLAAPAVSASVAPASPGSAIASRRLVSTATLGVAMASIPLLGASIALSLGLSLPLSDPEASVVSAAAARAARLAAAALGGGSD